MLISTYSPQGPQQGNIRNNILTNNERFYELAL